MAIRRDWKGPEILARIRVNARAAVKRSAIILQSEIKMQLNQGASNRGATPSTPPAPPHKGTGQLSQSVQVTTAESELRPFAVHLHEVLLPFLLDRLV